MELKEGEIYYCERYNTKFIFRADNITDNQKTCTAIRFSDKFFDFSFILSRPRDQKENYLNPLKENLNLKNM